MGFQVLSKFNDAMLPEQVWQLLHDTGSLFYRAFKVKYLKVQKRVQNTFERLDPQITT